MTDHQFRLILPENLKEITDGMVKETEPGNYTYQFYTKCFVLNDDQLKKDRRQHRKCFHD